MISFLWNLVSSASCNVWVCRKIKFAEQLLMQIPVLNLIKICKIESVMEHADGHADSIFLLCVHFIKFLQRIYNKHWNVIVCGLSVRITCSVWFSWTGQGPSSLWTRVHHVLCEQLYGGKVICIMYEFPTGVGVPEVCWK
jgi:hypothetical protein